MPGPCSTASKLAPSAPNGSKNNDHGPLASRWLRGGIAALATSALAIGTFALIPTGSRIPTVPIKEATASPSGEKAAIATIRPRSSRTDEIAQEIQEAWRSAGKVEAGLHLQDGPPDHDSFSSLAAELAQRILVLETDLASGGEGLPKVPSLSPTLNHNQRR